MPNIEVDEQTYRSIELASKLTGVTPGAVVSRLVEQTIAVQERAPEPAKVNSDEQIVVTEPHEWIPIFNDYAGHRTKGRLFPITGRVELTSGPLTGRHAASPSQAARMVVAHYKPDVDSNRNGWTFWMIDDGSGRQIQSVRRVDPPDQRIPRRD